MRKIMIIPVTLLVILSLNLVACQSGSTTETTTPPTTPPTTSQPTTSLPTTTEPTSTPEPTTPEPTPTPEPTTPEPTPTPEPTTPEPTTGFSDPAEDLFYEGGPNWDEPVPWTGGTVRYIDIINTELTLSGGEYIARMVLEGQLPAETEYEEIFVEWDLLIDADRSTATGWDWPLMCNDTGPDHLFRVYLLDDTYVGNYLNIGTGVWGNQQYQIDGNTVELYIPVSIGLPDEFEYTFAVRLYGSRGDPNDLLLADKAPDEGHYTFEATE